MTRDPPPGGLSVTLAENIAALTARRATEAREAPLADRIAGQVTHFTGSMRFVTLHLLLFGAWIAINLGWVPGIPRFDPSFVQLAMVASVEAIFLSTFVLIAQNRMQRAADRRADLDLHINLLAEHELSRIGDLLTRMAERLGVDAEALAFDEIRQLIHPERVLDAIDHAHAREGLDDQP